MKKKVTVDDTLKFAWAYLILHGKFTDGRWSYYGSGWEDVEGPYVEWNKRAKQAEEFRAKVVSVGIDWEKTSVPEVDDYHGFAGTFADTSDKCLGTLGTLVLKNGESFMIGSADDDAAHLAKTAREMMRKPGESEVEKFAKKL